MLLATSLFAMAPAGVAMSTEERFTLHEGGYAAWRALVPEGGTSLTVGVDGEVSDAASQFRRATWIWSPADFEGTLLTSHGGSLFSANRAFIQSDDFGVVQVNPYHVGCPLLPCAGFAGSHDFELPSEGEWVVLVVVGADGPFEDEGSVVLTFGKAVEILGTSSGSAFLDREEQFHGKLSIIHETRWSYLKQQESVQARRTLADGFFGYFTGTSDSGQLVMGYDGPAGAVDGALEYRFDNAPGGDYVFRVDKDFETTWGSYTTVFGAIVAVPGPVPALAAMDTAAPLGPTQAGGQGVPGPSLWWILVGAVVAALVARRVRAR